MGVFRGARAKEFCAGSVRFGCRSVAFLLTSGAAFWAAEFGAVVATGMFEATILSSRGNYIYIYAMRCGADCLRCGHARLTAGAHYCGKYGQSRDGGDGGGGRVASLG